MSKLKAQIYNLKLKSIKLKSLAILVVVLSFALCVLRLGNVSAQSILPLTVAPARQELNLNPGEKTTISVRFYNLADTPVAGIVKAADFVVENEKGIPRIVENFEQTPPRFAASQWITLPYDRMSIAATDKVSVPITITVPADARPGGRYLSVYFEPSPATPAAVGSPKEAGMSVAPRIASLIYIKIAGDTQEKALISRFFAPSFFEYGPINIDSEILNRGDYHIRPRGAVILTNMFGGLIAQEKLKEQNIFPDTGRTYTNSLGPKWMFGRYKVSLMASYGEKGQALNRFIYVWVFPWKVALIIILALMIFFFLGRNFYNKTLKKEGQLEKEIAEEKEEIAKLREALRKRKD